MTITPEELILRRRAYWLSLKGYGEVSSKTTTTIDIPVSNVLNIDALQKLMAQSEAGEI